MTMQQLYLLVPLAPLAGVDRRRPVRREARPRGLALAVHPRRGRRRSSRRIVIWRDVRRGTCSTATSIRGSQSGDAEAVDRLPDRPADGDDDARRHVRVADGARLHHRLHGRRPRLHALLQLHLALHVLDADAGDEQQLPAALLRLGGGRPRLLPADRLLVHAAARRSTRTSRRSSPTASATSASCSASASSSRYFGTLDYAPVFAKAPALAGDDHRALGAGARGR